MLLASRARGQYCEGQNMNQTALVLLIVTTGITSLACVLCAAFLLWHNRKGWGWFLFVAFLIAGSVAPVLGVVN